jgi:hypothetical protein
MIDRQNLPSNLLFEFLFFSLDRWITNYGCSSDMNDTNKYFQFVHDFIGGRDRGESNDFGDREREMRRVWDSTGG